MPVWFDLHRTNGVSPKVRMAEQKNHKNAACVITYVVIWILRTLSHIQLNIIEVYQPWSCEGLRKSLLGNLEHVAELNAFLAKWP